MTQDLQKAMELSEGILGRVKELKQLVGDADYWREVNKTKPYVKALTEASEQTSPLGAVLDFVDSDGSLDRLAASVLICTAVEMVIEKGQP